ncbi:MAG: hypothetical protein D6685_13710 [Bacteroidetes bacterium]|nr:MAG: hypothetical protein D6685_13710 [Bacteroidota bacterium]
MLHQVRLGLDAQPLGAGLLDDEMPGQREDDLVEAPDVPPLFDQVPRAFDLVLSDVDVDLTGSQAQRQDQGKQ